VAESSRLDLVDEPAQALLVRYTWAGVDAPDRLAHVLLEVGKGLKGKVGLHPHFLLNLPLYLLVREGEHPAVGVVDEDDFACAQKTLGDGKRANLVVGYDTTGAADHVRVSLLEPEHPIDVKPGIHAGYDRYTLCRGAG